MPITFRKVSHVDAVFRQLDANAQRCMPKIGEAVVESVQEQMLYGYHTPHGPDGHTEIVDTGALYESITADVQKASQNSYSVNVGVPAGTDPAGYVDYVHDGTYKLQGRPFLRDGVLNSVEKQKEIYGEELPVGFR